MDSHTTYVVAPHPALGERDRHFLTEGAAVEFAGKQADASFTTPEWSVQRRETDPYSRVTRTVEWLFVNRAGEVARRHTPEAVA